MTSFPIATASAQGTVLGYHDEVATGIPIDTQLVALDRTGGGPYTTLTPSGATTLAPSTKVNPARLKSATISLRASFDALVASPGGVTGSSTVSGATSGGSAGSGASTTPVVVPTAPATVSKVGLVYTSYANYAGGPAITKNACTGWNATQIYRAACITVVPLSVDKTPNGNQCVQITNAPGDSPNPPGSPYTRRSELLQLLDSSGASVTEGPSATQIWYDALWKFPTGYNLPNIAGNPDNWAIVLQLHSPDTLSASPAFALDCGILVLGGPVIYTAALDGGDIANGQNFVRLRFLGNTTNTTPGSATLGPIRPECAGETPISPADAEKCDFDNWTEFNFGFVWATDTTGSVVIQRKNRLTNEWQTVASKSGYTTLQWNSKLADQVDGNGKPTPGPHYWKQGIYLGDHPDSNVSTITATFKTGPFLRGTQAQVRAYGG